MSFIELNNFLKYVRSRKHVSTRRVRKKLGRDFSLARVEKGLQMPRVQMREAFFDMLDIPKGGFLFAHLENQPMKAYIMRKNLIRALDKNDADSAKAILDNFEGQNGFREGINRQFILSYNARLMELQGESSAEILKLTHEAMKFTFPNFLEEIPENPEAEILLFAEAEILHTMARALHGLNRREESIRLLNYIQTGLDFLPVDCNEKEIQLLPILLTLCAYTAEAGSFEAALEICRRGEDLSYIRARGRYNPGFVYIRALCLRGLGRGEEASALLHQAYVGYLILGKKDEADKIANEALEKFGVVIETYGADDIAFEFSQNIMDEDTADPILDIVCKKPGNLIGSLRKSIRPKYGAKQLCEGVCTSANVASIEGGNSEAGIYKMEIFMERLGRDKNLYFVNYVSKQEFDEIKLRDRIGVDMLYHWYDKAEEKMPELEKREYYKTGLGRQFVLTMNLTLERRREPRRSISEAHENRIRDALGITWLDFVEKGLYRDVGRRRLTYLEIIILNQWAGYRLEIGDVYRASSMYEALLDSIEESYMDDTEKARTYSNIAYNFSNAFIELGQFDIAFEGVNKGIAFEVEMNSIFRMPNLLFSKGCCLYEMKEHEKSIPYLVSAYYLASMFARYGYAERLPGERKFLKARFNIDAK